MQLLVKFITCQQIYKITTEYSLFFRYIEVTILCYNMMIICVKEFYGGMNIE